MIIHKTLSDTNIQYYKQLLVSKLNGTNCSFSWGLFSLYLYCISSEKALDSLTKENFLFASTIERFICDTDILDDIMDNDNHILNNLSKKNQFFREFLRCDLLEIFNTITYNSEKRYEFALNLYLSLKAQVSNVSDFLSLDSCLQDYFSKVVDRSFYLMNAIVQISVSQPNKNLLPFSYYYAVSSQIENDVQNILKKNPPDIIALKPTLPILISLNLAKNNDSLELFDMLIKKRDNAIVESVKNSISNNGILEYCRWIALKCKEKAQNELNQLYPRSKKYIQEFFNIY